MNPRALTILAALSLAGLGVVIGGHGAYGATVITVNVFADSTGNPAQCSLRSAIAAVNAHGTVDGCVGAAGAQTISLPAGTYTVTGGIGISQPVTITGANAGVDGRGPRGAGSIIDFNATTTGSYTNILFPLLGAGGASTFNGLELRGQLDPANPNDEVNAIVFEGGAPAPSFTLENSTIGSFTFALYVSGVGETVKNNDFLGELAGVGDPNVIGAYGNAIYGDFDSSNVTVQDNRFAGYSNGAFVYDKPFNQAALTNLVIQRNTVRDDNSLAFLVGHVDGATIANNWITADPAHGGIRGIVITDDSTNISIVQNTIDNQTTDISPTNRGSAIRVRLDDPQWPPNSNIAIHGNRIAGNSTAFYVSAGALSGPIDATGNWWGANTGIGGLGGSGQNANGINTAVGTATGINAGSPLQLVVDCAPASGYVIGSAGSFTGTIASMPTWYTALGHYAASWPQAANPGDPLWSASATGAAISSFTAIASGSGAEAYGGTVSGSMTPTAETGSVALGVDQELIGCAWTAADAPALAATGLDTSALAATGPADGPALGTQLLAAELAIVLGAALIALARRRGCTRRV